MTSSLELNFDSKPENNHIYSTPLKSFGEHSSDQKPQKIEEFVARLEEERLKIDAFKRELPLCMQLLNNAMEASRQQLQLQGINQGSRPVLEEFIPLKNNICSTEAQKDYLSADKANWMTSAQLWNPENHDTNHPQVTDVKLASNGKQIINGNGAFLPFSSKDRNSPSFPELALASSHNDQVEDMKHNSLDRIENSIRSGNSSVKEKEQFSGSPANNSQAQRKARRCWSPDLHRRFVNALHMLGGSQVATPKQIRELMKVDGLTNDEVKSHLQKYRLHTRRPSPSPHTPISTAPQLVVLGGIWVPPEYAAAAAHSGAQAVALYGAHATTAHHMSPNFSSVGPPSMTHDMYATITPQSTSANHMHHQLQVYNRALMDQRNSLPAPEVPCASGEPSESIEDEKSESGSWKADSYGENGAERKRVEGEENNASSIAVSLMF